VRYPCRQTDRRPENPHLARGPPRQHPTRQHPTRTAHHGPATQTPTELRGLLNPSLICEVLSSSTEGYDRGDELALYRTVPSLKEYLLVSQHRVQVDLCTRDDTGRWILTSFDRPTDEVALPGIHCTLVLADVYDKIELQTA
jgi:hypothetical protein